MSSRQENGSSTRISLNFPESREQVWGTHESEMLTWQVGDVVFLRNDRWRVVGRQEEADLLSLHFAFAQHEDEVAV